MSNNSFGKFFKVTTWGESHGDFIGVVVDGCPAGLVIDKEDIIVGLQERAPGRSKYSTSRKEDDFPDIVSGIFEGKTTGAPIAIVIKNKDHDSSKYEGIKDQLRPGHATFTYLEKYGIFDYRGGGRSSARETVARVAAGGIARLFLKEYNIEVVAYVSQIYKIKAEIPQDNLRELSKKSPIFCPDLKASTLMEEQILQVKKEGDSLGGVVEFRVDNLPVGLGDPVYNKLESQLASALMSIPATKGVEIGMGFSSVEMKGSEHNDSFYNEGGVIKTRTNNSGGLLGGISNGMPLIGRVAFKPTSSVFKEQETVDLQGNKTTFNLPEGSRHDPCVVPRAVPVVEAMVNIVLADSLLSKRSYEPV